MIHKEGHKLLGILSFIVGFSSAMILYLMEHNLKWLLVLLLFTVFGLVLQFFRNPSRPIAITDDNLIYAPADGKVVVIEEIVETEYFNEKRIQLSIFMSPFNVHVNRFPIGGIVKYFKYHPGLFLLAWEPKSSTHNERTTVVVENEHGTLLFRQIAGFVARRILYYCKENDQAVQGKEFGFIKFGSRVDIFLPLDATILVQKEQKVVGNTTVIAAFR